MHSSLSTLTTRLPLETISQHSTANSNNVPLIYTSLYQEKLMEFKRELSDVRYNVISITVDDSDPLNNTIKRQEKLIFTCLSSWRGFSTAAVYSIQNHSYQKLRLVESIVPKSHSPRWLCMPKQSSKLSQSGAWSVLASLKARYDRPRLIHQTHACPKENWDVFTIPRSNTARPQGDALWSIHHMHGTKARPNYHVWMAKD